jgi:hypothetical protein
MDDEKQLEILDWLASLIPRAVVIDVDEEGNPTDLTQLNELSERIGQKIEEIKKDER